MKHGSEGNDPAETVNLTTQPINHKSKKKEA
jgi:hypothetical protein